LWIAPPVVVEDGSTAKRAIFHPDL
jgi:hypothetical protein